MLADICGTQHSKYILIAFMVPPNGHQGGTVCRFVAMSNKHTASRKVEWNGNFEARNLKNYIKTNHENSNIN